MMRGTVPVKVLIVLFLFNTEQLKIYANDNSTAINGNESSTPTWTLFPYADGNIHNISLEIPKILPFQLEKLPENIEFRLYTRRNKEAPQLIGVDMYLNETFFNPSLVTKLLIHGWRGRGNGPYLTNIKNSYLATSDVNVIVLDWSELANFMYVLARIGMPQIAIKTADLIEFHVLNKGVTLEKLHIIGHSLGAHMAGMIAKNIYSGKIAYILGLDPALPLFSHGDPYSRLDVGDADYVEVIHTNGGFLGFLEPIGHADFYPNGGKRQPACSFDIFGICSHIIGLDYLDESIKAPKSFKATKCNGYNEVLQGVCLDKGNYQKMGEILPKERNLGIFWLQTSDKSPYSLS